MAWGDRTHRDADVRLFTGIGIWGGAGLAAGLLLLWALGWDFRADGAWPEAVVAVAAIIAWRLIVRRRAS